VSPLHFVATSQSLRFSFLLPSCFSLSISISSWPLLKVGYPVSIKCLDSLVLMIHVKWAGSAPQTSHLVTKQCCILPADNWLSALGQA
jgi:hypothetical protein